MDSKMAGTKMESLCNKIKKMASMYPERIKLNPVIDLETVKEIETKYNVALPNEYVDFITQIGDGGYIPPGLTSDTSHDQIRSLAQFIASGYTLDGADQPFPFKESWVPDYGDSITEDDSSLSDEEYQQRYDALWETIYNDGHIILIDDNTDANMQWFLIVTGPCKGEVWFRFEGGIMRTGCDFATWLELHLDGELDRYLKAFHAKERESQLTPVQQCSKRLKSGRVKLKPPISVEEVCAFEQRHNITLPSEYVQLITEIGDGGAKLPYSITKIYSLMENDCLDDLDQPFFFQTQAEIEQYLMEERYGRLIFSHFPPVWPRLFSCQPDTPVKGVWRRPQFQMLHGCLPIMLKEHQKSHWLEMTQYVLILNGEFTGEVWGLSDGHISTGHDVDHDYKPITAFTCMGNVIDGIY